MHGLNSHYNFTCILIFIYRDNFTTNLHNLAIKVDSFYANHALALYCALYCNCYIGCHCYSGFSIHGFDYSHYNILESNTLLTACSKPGLALCGFAIHIYKILERSPRKYRGKPVYNGGLPLNRPSTYLRPRK